MKPTHQPVAKAEGRTGRLRPLLFQYDLGLFGRYLFLFLPVGARNVTERRRLRCGTELPQRTLPLGIRVSIGRAADQGMLASHRRERSMLRMIRHLDHAHLTGQQSRLSEGSSGAENHSTNE